MFFHLFSQQDIHEPGMQELQDRPAMELRVDRDPGVRTNGEMNHSLRRPGRRRRRPTTDHTTTAWSSDKQDSEARTGGAVGLELRQAATERGESRMGRRTVGLDHDWFYVNVWRQTHVFSFPCGLRVTLSDTIDFELGSVSKTNTRVSDRK
jgi:hypothetical protein